MTSTRIRFIAGIFVSLSPLMAIAQNAPAAKDAAPVTKATTTAPSTVIATVGDAKLTYGELQAFKKFFAPRGTEDERLITFWKFNAALARMAQQDNMQKDPDAEAVIKIASDQVLGSVYIRYKQLEAAVTDQEVQEYYKQNDREFRENAFVTAKMIAAEKREQADQIKKQLVEGANFDKLVADNRAQTLKTTGLSDVEIKDAATDQLIKPLGPSVAYSMGRVTLNEINGPRQIPNGWIIFKVTDRKPGKLIPLQKVEKDIREQLNRRKQIQVRTDIVAKAEKMAGVKLESQGGPARPGMVRPGTGRPTTRPMTRPAK